MTFSFSTKIAPPHECDLPAVAVSHANHSFPSFEGVQQSPTPVDNWTYFDGAVAALALLSAPSVFLGTAVLLAPGIAVTAAHNLSDDHGALVEGTTSAVLLAPRADGEMDVWEVVGNSTMDNDIALLAIRLRTVPSVQWRMSVLHPSARTPVVDEPLTVVGFRANGCKDGDVVDLHGDLFASSGPVGEIRQTTSSVRQHRMSSASSAKAAA
jgi:hypothetical protein